MNTFTDGTQAFHPLQPSHASMQAPQPPVARYAQPDTSAVGEKLQQDSNGFEEPSRVAAEEDKRRRNTAASARFRIKKKQREQALEKSAKEMTDKVTSLENKVSQLETENKWLKNLLVEKNEGNEDITTMWKEFTKQASEKMKGTKAESTSNSSAVKDDR